MLPLISKILTVFTIGEFDLLVISVNQEQLSQVKSNKKNTIKYVIPPSSMSTGICYSIHEILI